MIKMVFSRVEAKRAGRSAQVLGVPVDKSAVTIYAPVVVGRKGEYYQLLYDLLGKGFERVVIDGKQQSLREKIVLDRNKRHSIDAIVDSIYVSEFARTTAGARERLSEALKPLYGYLLRIHDFQKHYRCEEMSPGMLGTFAQYFKPGEHRFTLWRDWPESAPELLGAGMAELVVAELVRLLPAYRAIAWSPDHDLVFANRA